MKIKSGHQRFSAKLWTPKSELIFEVVIKLIGFIEIYMMIKFQVYRRKLTNRATATIGGVWRCVRLFPEQFSASLCLVCR